MTDRDRLIELVDKAKEEYANDITDHTETDYIVETLLNEGVILPPCKVGDIVYAKYSAPYIKQLGVDDVGYYVVDNVTHFGSDNYVFEAHLENEDGYTVDTIAFFQHEFGKTVFLTKEEAEQKLKELGK